MKKICFVCVLCKCIFKFKKICTKTEQQKSLKKNVISMYKMNLKKENLKLNEIEL